jgi:inorganic pyrophosphatase
MTTQYTIRPVKAAHTLEHRVFIERDGVVISPWHDIPLYADKNNGILNMIVEIPRWSNAKMETSKEEKFNPVLQDTKKGKLRFVRNSFPYHGYIWNYGAFPQTWEDPNETNPDTKAKGDNDPLDVCEIGAEVAHVGQIKQVKVLGIMALLDEGETDWKVIVVDVKDPLASKLNDIDDVEKQLPGLVRSTEEWFRIYKIPDGKPANEFAFSGQAKNKEYANVIIHECFEAWQRLISGKTPANGISIINGTQHNSAGYTEPNDPIYKEIPARDEKPPAAIDASISQVFYVNGEQVA